MAGGSLLVVLAAALALLGGREKGGDTAPVAVRADDSTGQSLSVQPGAKEHSSSWEAAGSTAEPSQQDGVVRTVYAQAAVFIPRTWDQVLETTTGPALVKILDEVRVETDGHTRHQATVEEAASLNATRPPNSPKPEVQPGDWIGDVGRIRTLYSARVEWLDGSGKVETLELGFIGGRASDVFLVVEGLPLPRVGGQYLMFPTIGDGWVTPAYVQFVVENGRLAPHAHNEAGLGRDLLGKTPADVADQARTARNR